MRYELWARTDSLVKVVVDFPDELPDRVGDILVGKVVEVRREVVER